MLRGPRDRPSGGCRRSARDPCDGTDRRRRRCEASHQHSLLDIRPSKQSSAGVFFARPLVGPRWTAGQGPLAQKTPTLLNPVPATPAGTGWTYECLVVVSGAPVVVRTPRRSARAGVAVGVARVADVFTTGGWRGAATSLTFALA